MRLAFTTAVLGAAMSIANVASAGGMDMPDNGTEALGRGGAFTAKADDPTAIYYNIAGLAQQRGTRLLVNANLSKSSLDFERAGTYPGDPQQQPYAGKRFPRAESEGGVSKIPFLAVTSDFGLENATFALGSFAPPAVGGRVYPLTTPEGLPSPARYDTVGGKASLVLFHTAAAAFRLGEHLELGLSAHLVQIEIGTRLVNYMDQLGPDCSVKNENQACDARGEATTKAWSATGSAGAMLRPREDVAIGLNVKGPTKIAAEGVADITAPSKVPTAVPPTRVALSTQLPWIFRAGVRKVFGVRNERHPVPIGDLELDVTYELWGEAMNPGPQIVLEQVPLVGRLTRTAVRNYENTFSLRAGGSYSPDTSLPITLRGGAYFDKSATAPENTRLDTDTLDKLALTAGAGLRFDAWRIDIAYASVFDIARSVEQGAIKSSSKPDATVVNQGIYSGHTHIASIGATIELDVLFGSTRMPQFKRGEGQIARR